MQCINIRNTLKLVFLHNEYFYLLKCFVLFDGDMFVLN